MIFWMSNDLDLLYSLGRGPRVEVEYEEEEEEPMRATESQLEYNF